MDCATPPDLNNRTRILHAARFMQNVHKDERRFDGRNYACHPACLAAVYTDYLLRQKDRAPSLSRMGLQDPFGGLFNMAAVEIVADMRAFSRMHEEELIQHVLHHAEAFSEKEVSRIVGLLTHDTIESKTKYIHNLSKKTKVSEAERAALDLIDVRGSAITGWMTDELDIVDNIDKWERQIRWAATPAQNDIEMDAKNLKLLDIMHNISDLDTIPADKLLFTARVQRLTHAFSWVKTARATEGANPGFNHDFADAFMLTCIEKAHKLGVALQAGVFVPTYAARHTPTL
jgi:hypothetical protein